MTAVVVTLEWLELSIALTRELNAPNTVGEGLGPPAFVIVTPDDISAVILSIRPKVD